MGNPKHNTNELIYQTETDSQMKKTNLQLPKRRGDGGEINQEYKINIHTPLYIKQSTKIDYIAQGTMFNILQ